MPVLEADLVTSLTVKFFEQAERSVKDTLVGLGWSTGRAAAAVASNFVIGAEYSAILDGRQCEFCAALDGMEVEMPSELYTRFSPPQHNRCRCQWIPIKADDPLGFQPTNPKDIPRTVFAGADPGEIVARFGHANEALEAAYQKDVRAARQRIMDRKKERLVKRLANQRDEARREAAMTPEEKAARDRRKEAARKGAETRAKGKSEGMTGAKRWSIKLNKPLQSLAVDPTDVDRAFEQYSEMGVLLPDMNRTDVDTALRYVLHGSTDQARITYDAIVAGGENGASVMVHELNEIDWLVRNGANPFSATDRQLYRYPSHGYALLKELDYELRVAGELGHTLQKPGSIIRWNPNTGDEEDAYEWHEQEMRALRSYLDAAQKSTDADDIRTHEKWNDRAQLWYDEDDREKVRDFFERITPRPRQ